jgi:ArsR family transcriptional regulator
MADAVGLSQPTVSHHLKVLVEAGVLTRERRGTWAWYTLVPDQLSEISSFLD